MTQAIRTIRIATQGPAGPAGPMGPVSVPGVYDVASQAAMLALAAAKGDIARRGDVSKCFILAASDPTVLANWKELLTPPDAVTSVAGLTGAVGSAALKGALAIMAGDVTGLAASATTDTTDAANIAAGTLSNARLSGVALTANNLADLANPATARTNIGLGAASSPAFAGLTLSSPLTAANGGSGHSSYSKGDLLAASGATTLAKVGVGADGQVITADSTQAAGLKWSTPASSQIIVVAASAAGVSHTGDTNLTTLATIAVPGNTLGPNGILRITVLWRFTGTAGTKTRRITFGGMTLYDQTGAAANLVDRMQTQIANRNATNSQVSQPASMSAFAFSNVADVVTASIDTTADQDIVLAGQLANSGDSIELASYLVEVIRP